ncbi:hypothetical protein IVG45_14065 [Methylomonas sp. LL1]|uniref:hypothetical protein n=1 Tax=Methylomonas sp. LL1 TaxID=2785785 RepID=UPI0018C35385|nr:hypothetical protein [Methylomonas sp. LL1]QPK61982.1 hypothetical protein IVG45_14065 [Methylomonas sp. LL1]
MKSAFKPVLGLSGVLIMSGWAMIGCDSKPQPAVVSQANQEKYDKLKTLEGLVSNDQGPAKTGLVKVLTEQGRELSRVELADSPRYSVDVPAGTLLPVILAYYPTADAGEEQRMITVAIHAAASKYDINPLSTRIAKQARALGGYTHKNWVRAAESFGTVPDNNKTTAGFRGDPTSQYGGWH